jgi:hypothetical protein
VPDAIGALFRRTDLTATQGRLEIVENSARGLIEFRRGIQFFNSVP